MLHGQLGMWTFVFLSCDLKLRLPHEPSRLVLPLLHQRGIKVRPRSLRTVVAGAVRPHRERNGPPCVLFCLLVITLFI